MNIQTRHNECADTLTVRLFDVSLAEGFYTIDRLLIGPIACVFVKGVLVEYTIHNYARRNMRINKIWSQWLGKSFDQIVEEQDRQFKAILSY